MEREEEGESSSLSVVLQVCSFRVNFFKIEFSIGFIIAGRPKRLFVIVNPFGGDGIGKKVFARTVEPLLKAAGVTIIMQGKDSI